MTIAGIHCLLEMYGCDPRLLDDPALVHRALRDAADRAGATWLGEARHRFEPAGVTCLGLLAESHIAIHTWPEIGYAAADVFTCGDTAVAERACEHLLAVFAPQRSDLRRLPRGAGLTPAELAGIDPTTAHLATRD